MIAGLAIGSDARRYFHFSLPRIAILTIVLMPLLYGALYLWTFWNPFGEVDKIPVAIVNSDDGTTVAGEALDAGEQVTQQLIESGQLNLTKVDDKATAMSDLENGTYYFVIDIPEDFSAAVASPTGNDPRQAELTFYFNDANSYLSTIIGQDASEQVINQVNSAISKQAVGEVLTAVAGAEPVADDAVEGAEQLGQDIGQVSGAVDDLASGVEQITEPLQSAATNSDALATAADDLATRVDSVADQLQANVSANPLPTQIEAIGNEVTTPINNVVAALNGIDLPAAQDAANNLQAASNRLTEITGSMSTTIAQADTGAIAAIGEVKATADGLDRDAAALSQIINEIAAGSRDVATGTAELAEGLDELSTGVDRLASGFSSILARAPQWTPDQRDAVASALGTPVLLKQDTLNEAPNFGTGFAPFFMSLSLYVGAILAWMVLEPMRRRPVESGVKLFRTVWISYWPALIVGFLQALILYGVVMVIGLRPAHVLGMGLFVILVSATFLAMIQAFNAIFGAAVGRVVTLAFLMLQLVSSGGIYPVETTAGPIQALHAFDPMTYTVNGYRQLSVAETVDSRLWISIAVLAGILVVSLGATALSARRDRIYTMSRLYPMVVV